MLRKQDSFIFRSKLLKIFFGFLFAVLVVRLYVLQIDNHGKFAALAEKQHWVGKKILAQRGEILASDNYALASNVPAYLIFGVPREIENPEETANSLIDIMGYDSQVSNKEWETYKANLDSGMKELENPIEKEREEIIKDMTEMFSQDELLYVPIADKQSEEAKSKIEEKGIKGIYFEKDYKRFYPEGEMSANVLGFVGKNDRGEDQGYYGIEGYFNGDLKGISGRVALEKDALGRPIPVGQYLPVSSDDGHDIILTINRELQYLIEGKLKAGVEKYDAQNGSVILMEPQTGKILAMVSYPTYNPGNWEDWGKDYSEKEEEDLTDEEKLMKEYGVDIFPNLSVADVFEPGSIFKPITMSMGLDKNIYDEGTLIESAPFPISNYTIRTWNNKYYGNSVPEEILQHSDNTGMARISQMIGLETFYEYLGNYGFLSKTGISLEDEDLGWIRAQEDWREVDLATAGFGQGAITVTPIQMMQAYTGFLNKGRMMKPYIVQEVKSNDASLSFEPEAKEQVISEETASEIVDMLVSVVEKGEFKFAVLPGYKMGGKTGTAQIAKNGIYDANQTNCSFIGFAPASDPKFLMIVKLTRPTASTYSAETAVPLWMDIAKDLFVYFGVKPEE